MVLTVRKFTTPDWWGVNLMLEKSTVGESLVITKVCKVIKHVLLDRVIRLANVQEITYRFSELGFPNRAGAKDEKHIPILYSPSPTCLTSKYIN